MLHSPDSTKPERRSPLSSVNHFLGRLRQALPKSQLLSAEEPLTPADRIRSSSTSFTPASIQRFFLRRSLRNATFRKKLDHSSSESVKQALTAAVREESLFLTDALSRAENARARYAIARESSRRIHGDIDSIARQMRQHAAWEGQHLQQFAQSLMDLETFLFEQLYTVATRACENAVHDRALTQRIQLLNSFIKASHLDAPPLDEPISPGNDSFRAAMHSLSKMHSRHTPRAKLECLALSSKDLCRSWTLHHTQSLEGPIQDSSVGADQLLPCMILLVLRTDPPWLHSDLKFIEIYCDSITLKGEGGYLTTQIASAKHFIENLESSQLCGFDEGSFAGALTKAESLGGTWQEIEDSEDETEDIQVSSTDLDEYRRDWTLLYSEEGPSSSSEEDSPVVEELMAMFPSIEKEMIADLVKGTSDEDFDTVVTQLLDLLAERENNESFQPTESAPPPPPPLSSLAEIPPIKLDYTEKPVSEPGQSQSCQASIPPVLLDLFPTVQPSVIHCCYLSKELNLEDTIEALLEVTNSLSHESPGEFQI